MKIAQKLILGFTCIALLGALVAFVALHHLIKIEETFQKTIPASLVNIQETSYLNDLAQLIDYYDEVLTQSARNYGFTLDKKWETRYRDIEPKLDKAIKEAIARGDKFDKEFFESIDIANSFLVDMEHTAIEFANAGNSSEAIKILDSDYYANQKAVYAEALESYKHGRGISFHDSLLKSTQVAEQSLGDSNQLVANSRLTVSILFAAILVIGLVISVFVSRSISQPIEELENSAIEISRGTIPAKIERKSSGEIKLLITAFNRMISDLRSQRDKLVERSLMESLVESIQEGVIMLDKDGDVVVMNPQARAMLRLDKSVTDVYRVLQEKLEIVQLDKVLEKSSRDGTVERKEIIFPDNDKQILLCSVCPVKSQDRILGTAILFRDITIEKEAEDMKTEFISTVSHELRTPLAITKEGLSLILDKIAGEITDKQEKILVMAQDNIARLSRLINNLLDISKIEAGKMEVRNTKFDIVALTEKVMADFHLIADEKKLDLRINYPEKRMDVYADRDKIIQVLTNLINNAIKFTVKGHVEVSGKPAGDFIEFTVSDTGIGISKKDMDRTFNKFQQFQRAPGKGEKGTGLGLSIAKGIVEMLGGKIWVESKLGEGTKFHFTLHKFSEDLPFREFVQNRIADAQKSAEHMSLVMIHMQETNGESAPLADMKQERYLKEIENLINADLHRERDMTFRDSKICAAALANCDKGNVGSVCERIKGTMSLFLAREELEKKVEIEVGCATYPDDARNGDDLLKKIKAV